MSSKFSVAVLGAAGGIGQPLSLLLKQSLDIDRLVLFDVVPLVHGVAADLSHINSPSETKSFCGSPKDEKVQTTELKNALRFLREGPGEKIVVIPAGMARKPGMSRDDLFNINAGIVRGLISGVAEVVPDAFICIISNPVNSTVPIAKQVLVQKNKYSPKKLFGVSTLDLVRSNTFIAQKLGLNPHNVSLPVIGGHSGVTILPLLSHFEGRFSSQEIMDLTKRIQNAGTEVVEAKQGAGSATLSMAFAGARFVFSLMKGLSGSEVEECAYVDCSIVTEVEFFATKIKLGTNGVERVWGIDELGLSSFEQRELKEKVIPELQKAISKGNDFVLKAKL